MLCGQGKDDPCYREADQTATNCRNAGLHWALFCLLYLLVHVCLGGPHSP